MAVETKPLTREAAADLLIEQVPQPPRQRSHTYDDDIGVEWQQADRIIQLTVDPGQTVGRWLSFRRSDYPQVRNHYQYLDLQDPQSWDSMFTELQR